jgi:glycosyltransferase involved in cell wall biosynthesis
MNNINTSIICLTFNRLVRFKQSWEEVLKPVLDRHEDVEVIISDNGSTEEGKIEYIHSVIKDYPTVTLVTVGQNRGISSGNNIGLRLARGRKYRVLVEDDFYFLSPTWYEEALELHQTPEVGTVMWSLYFNDGTRYEPEGQKIYIGDKEFYTPIRRTLGPWFAKLETYKKVGHCDIGLGVYGCNDLAMYERFFRAGLIVFAPAGFTTPEIKPENSCLTSTHEEAMMRTISRDENYIRLREMLELPQEEFLHFDEWEGC